MEQSDRLVHGKTGHLTVALTVSGHQDGERFDETLSAGQEALLYAVCPSE